MKTKFTIELTVEADSTTDAEAFIRDYVASGNAVGGAPWDLKNLEFKRVGSGAKIISVSKTTSPQTK
jgi:hypothetical protein